MKTLLTVITFALMLPALCGEKIKFETTKELMIGESNAFELNTTNRAVLKTADGTYIVLDFVSSNREDGDNTFTEMCSISWTLINPSSIQSKIENAFIQYRSVKTEADSITVETIGGSDKIDLGGLSVGWSFASDSSVFIYPLPGTEYAIARKSNKAEMATPRKPSD